MITDEKILEIFQYPTINCKQISEITGLSLYHAKKLRKEILNKYSDVFPYSQGNQVRTDHFIQFYDSARFYELYKRLYSIDLRVR